MPSQRDAVIATAYVQGVAYSIASQKIPETNCEQ